jgi:hypothetical protein
MLNGNDGHSLFCSLFSRSISLRANFLLLRSAYLYLRGLRCSAQPQPLWTCKLPRLLFVREYYLSERLWESSPHRWRRRRNGWQVLLSKFNVESITKHLFILSLLKFCCATLLMMLGKGISSYSDMLQRASC